MPDAPQSDVLTVNLDAVLPHHERRWAYAEGGKVYVRQWVGHGYRVVSMTIGEADWLAAELLLAAKDARERRDTHAR